MLYGIAKRASRKGDKLGTGEIEGVVAPETAAHAAGTSALLSNSVAPGTLLASWGRTHCQLRLSYLRRIASVVGFSVPEDMFVDNKQDVN